MVNSNNVTRKFTMKEKLASLGPGFVIVDHSSVPEP